MDERGAARDWENEIVVWDYYSRGGNNGRVRFITDYLDGNYSVDISYDDHNRLTAYGNYRSYTYYEWNNLKTVSSGNGVGEAPNYSLSYATNASGAPSTNRINNTGYTFDSAGNVTNDNSLAYTYDAASRLKTAGSNNSSEYDGDGNKVKSVSGTYPLYYLWSSVLGEPVVELDGSGGVYRAYVTSSGGQMIAMQSYDGGFYWLHVDALGNGRKMTNSSGTVVYRAEYDPHGQMLYEWSSTGATFLNSHKFTGYERDWSTNLDNAKARTFNHNKGRFMQPDPLGLGAADMTDPQSLNLYSYVQNDPVNFVDPSGLLLVEVCEADRAIPSKSGGEIIAGRCYLVDIPWAGGGGPIGTVGGGGGGGGRGGGSQGGQSAKEVAKCLGKGILVGAVGAAVVGGIALVVAGTVAAPVVAAGLAIAAVVGGGIAVVNAVKQYQSGNWAGVAYTAGTFVGGYGAGRISGLGATVSGAINPTSTRGGWSPSRDIKNIYNPWYKDGSLSKFFGSGPDEAATTSASALTAAGPGGTLKGGC